MSGFQDTICFSKRKQDTKKSKRHKSWIFTWFIRKSFLVKTKRHTETIQLTKKFNF